MKIAIAGIGGIGGFYGGLLGKRYHDDSSIELTFIARGASLAALRQNGLKLITPKEEICVRPAHVTDRPGEAGKFDLVLLCTKAYHLDAMAETLKPAVGPDTVVITVLNGVDNAERLQAHFPAAQVLNGGIYVSATLLEPGVVRHNGGAGRTLFGAEQGPHERYRPIETLLKEAGVPAEYREDIRWAIWEKYLFIEPMGSATSFRQKTFGGLRADPADWQLVSDLLGEVIAVAKAEGVEVPANAHQMTVDKYISFPPETKTSMQVDFEKGGQTEIETFTGYIVRSGHRLGVPVPTHEQVYAALTR